MCIRRATLEDVKALSEISRKSLHESWSENAFVSEIQKPFSTVLIYEKEGEIQGFLVFSLVVDEGEILSFAVEEKHRKSGIGGELFRKTLKMLRSDGGAVLYLDVRESNTPAISFYAKMGMEKVTVRKGFYDNPKEDAVIFKIQL